MRASFLFTFATLASAAVLAQQPAPASPPPAAASTAPLPPGYQEQTEVDRGQRIERIVVEDAGSRVDELRVGGETKSITVQPKVGGDLPSYQVRPGDGARVWNLGRF